MKKHVMLLTIALFSGLMVFGQPQKGMRNGGFGNGMGYGYGNNSTTAPCLNRIPDLTEDQTQKINDLRIAMLKETQPVRNQINELRASCRTMMTSNNPDQAAIDKNIDQRAKLQAEIMKSHANYRLAVLNILTDDQKVFFNNAGPAGRGKCRMGQGRRGGNGFGPAWQNQN